MRATLEPPVTEAEQVYRWRADELERAGYDAEAAEVLALSLYVNLHQAVQLLRDGCDQTTAILILL